MIPIIKTDVTSDETFYRKVLANSNMLIKKILGKSAQRICVSSISYWALLPSKIFVISIFESTKTAKHAQQVPEGLDRFTC